jgi:hypothetical protein
MLSMQGSRVLHRGVSLGEDGERVLLANAYDETNRILIRSLTRLLVESVIELGTSSDN